MPISVTSGTLDRHLTSHSGAFINAYVIYAMSNGAQYEQAHLSIPAAEVQAIATAAGRTYHLPADICTWIETNVPDLLGTPITVASGPTSQT